MNADTSIFMAWAATARQAARSLTVVALAGAMAVSAATSGVAAASDIGGEIVGEIQNETPGVEDKAPAPIMLAQADCYAVGQQVAAQHGGELARANATSQGGQTVCVIVVLVPGKDGERPRRVQVVVPAG